MFEDKPKFDFTNLFTLDLANNHQGSLDHAMRIIREHGEVAKKEGVRTALKFQFRDLDTFIHPDFINDKNNKHISRFLSTRLSKDDYAKMTAEVKAQGMITMSTPFDEKSVDLIEELGIEVIKIASCSAKDWPLLEKVVKLNKPIIVSTGGMIIKDIDKLVSFLTHKYAHFALMHCVSIYPTPNEKLELEQIALMKDRYPHIVVGFSTHEPPENIEAIQIAFAKGARIFERHIGIATDQIKLNAYSSTPKQIEDWIKSYKRAVASCGTAKRTEVDPQEEKDLLSLMRGTFVKREIKKGETIGKDDVFFAIPYLSGQLTSGQFKSGTIADADYAKNDALPATLSNEKPQKKHIIYETIHAVKGMLNEARVPISHEYTVELSHHYGLDKFNETGVVIIDCVNREYCKKILVQLPGQVHPYHHHMKKEETFHILAGEVEIELEGKTRILYPGDTCVVPRGVKHRFGTKTGVIFEEISTTHYNDDSIYEDNKISSLPREERKTKLINWGRHQFD
jgi:sialic acid synthase SpsE/quercetin dioxygenase-like cupin family protein